MERISNSPVNRFQRNPLCQSLRKSSSSISMPWGVRPSGWISSREENLPSKVGWKPKQTTKFWFKRPHSVFTGELVIGWRISRYRLIQIVARDSQRDETSIVYLSESVVYRKFRILAIWYSTSVILAASFTRQIEISLFFPSVVSLSTWKQSVLMFYIKIS